MGTHGALLLSMGPMGSPTSLIIDHEEIARTSLYFDVLLFSTHFIYFFRHLLVLAHLYSSSVKQLATEDHERTETGDTSGITSTLWAMDMSRLCRDTDTV